MQKQITQKQSKCFGSDLNRAEAADCLVSLAASSLCGKESESASTKELTDSIRHAIKLLESGNGVGFAQCHIEELERSRAANIAMLTEEVILPGAEVYLRNYGVYHSGDAYFNPEIRLRVDTSSGYWEFRREAEKISEKLISVLGSIPGLGTIGSLGGLGSHLLEKRASRAAARHSWNRMGSRMQEVELERVLARAQGKL